MRTMLIYAADHTGASLGALKQNLRLNGYADGSFKFSQITSLKVIRSLQPEDTGYVFASAPDLVEAYIALSGRVQILVWKNDCLRAMPSIDAFKDFVATADHADAASAVAARPYFLADTTSKPSNPKDNIGSTKLPFHLWPETATALGCLGLLDGELKYGRSNFRAIGVRASIYYDAARRHLAAWFEGEVVDPDSGVPHLGHALACIAILVEAEAAGNLTDDRMFPAKYREWITQLTPHVARMQEKYKDRPVPHHYDIRSEIPGNLDASSE